MKLNGFVGGGTGKLGNSVFSQNAGRTIVRQYNPEVKNPNTERQQESRGRFTTFNGLAKLLAPAIAIGMPRVGALTSRNRLAKLLLPAVGTDYSNIIGTGEDDFEISYDDLIVSMGGMPKPNVSAVAYASGNTAVTFTIASAYDPVAAGYVPSQAGHAGIVCVVVEPVTGTCAIKQVAETEAGTVSVPVPEAMQGGRAFCFAFGKWIPESHNAISTDDTPWRYPSDQSDTCKLGHVQGQ